MTDTCHACNDEFKGITQHWRQSSCPYPEMSDYQVNLIEGLLLSDGSLYNHKKEGYRAGFQIEMANEEFLLWLDQELGRFSNGVRESTSKNEKRSDEYSDAYHLSTIAIPDMDQFVDWYSSGTKQYPEKLKPTPETIKMWFIGDGNLRRDGRCRISCANEMEHPEVSNMLFDYIDIGISWSNHEIYIDKSQTSDFFDYIGDPVPGFEYKWPN